MDVALFATLLFQVWIPGMGYETGAPTSVCGNMEPEHKGVTPQTNASPYTIAVSNSTFQTGKPITVVIGGSNYKGVLLQARSASSKEALGTWGTTPANTKYLQCSGIAQGAITHSNSNTKNNLTVFTWNPPSTTNSIYFVATIAKDANVYWLNVKSEMLTREGAAPGSADPKMATTPALLLLTLLIAAFQS
ncbi:putative defense protein Hdd11 [Electrophorus electricus]|uniref:putative defense protein Hdd11 n=1 Tax=Electrophorus electricus TaxID=8005 RepID=UPI0015CFA726|nr:putative defense protein Hdd11 [Electrophorus electricus]